MKRINQFLLVIVMAVLVSCADEYSSDFMTDKPSDVAMAEFLNQYDVLKSYIPSGLMLGAGIDASDFLKKETLYSLTITNFNEVALRDAMYHGSVVGDEGTMNFGNAMTSIDIAKQNELSVYGSALVWHAKQNDTYLEALIYPTVIPEIVIPPDVQSGTTVLFDFESNNIGDTWSMSNANGAATVAADPAGQSGKALLVHGPDGASTPANQSFPEFTVNLPEGRKLGDYVSLTLDLRINGGQGIYGQGMMMYINGKEATYNTPANFGCANDTWGRGLIVMPTANLSLSDADKQLTQFTLRVGSRTGAGNYYIDNIKMTWEMGASGKTTVADFESNNIGDTYPMSNADGAATVAADPKGQSGKALLIHGPGGTGTDANQSFPVFTVNLPTGRKLGDYTTVKLDMHINGGKGIYGQGMMLNINGKEATYGSPSSFGCPDNNWGRGLIDLPIANLNLTNAEKELTQFTLTVGSRTGAGNYYIDNVIMEWATGSSKPTIIPEEIIEKTPEEKKEILTNALESWIKGTMEACDGYVKAWDVVNEPMDDANPTALKTDPKPQTNPKEPVIDTYFYWQDHLGKDYARTAVKFARQYGGSGLKLFVNDYNLESNPAKCDGLIKMIQYWESDGVTKIDGIGTQMHVTCSLNPDTQKSNENKVVEMFNVLKATGKLIRISALDMKLTDANGTAVNTVNATFEQQTTMANYYNFIVRKYLEIIPAAQRYGITHWNSVQSSTNIGLWNSNYNRIYTYTGFADALK